MATGPIPRAAKESNPCGGCVPESVSGMGDRVSGWPVRLSGVAACGSGGLRLPIGDAGSCLGAASYCGVLCIGAGIKSELASRGGAGPGGRCSREGCWGCCCCCLSRSWFSCCLFNPSLCFETVAYRSSKKTTSLGGQWGQKLRWMFWSIVGIYFDRMSPAISEAFSRSRS